MIQHLKRTLKADDAGDPAKPAARWRGLLSGSAGLALLLACQPAAAQTDGTAEQAGSASDGDGEIVVTAQRREQSLQDVGIAVAAFSGETLKGLGLSSSTDVAQITPGVYVSGSYGGQTQQFTIRGVTQSDYSDSLETPVAVYVDDVYVPTQQGQTLALFDIQRVEILKGPQGTLFGRNATGGLVNTLVVQPDTHALGGYADLTYARFNEVKAEGAINLPLASTAALRVSGYYDRLGASWKNRFPEGMVAGAPLNFGPHGVDMTGCCKDLGGARTYAGRVQLKLEPAPGLTIRLSGSGADQKMSTSPYTTVPAIGTYDAQNRLVQADRASPTETRIAIGPGGGNYTGPGVMPFALFAFPGNGARAPGATWFGFVPLDADDLELSADYAIKGLNSASVWSASAHVDYDLGSVKIASITAYQHHKKMFLLQDGMPVNGFGGAADARTTAFSQELRASGGSRGLLWTAGVYYLDNLVHSGKGLLGPTGSIVGAVFGRPDGIELNSLARLHTRSLSGFGQVEIGLADKWTLILGGRIIRQSDTYHIVMNAYKNLDDYKFDTDVVLFPYAAPYNDKRTNTLWAGKAQIEYRPFDKMLVYAGINRGVKGGAYNAPGPGTPLTRDQMSYDPETLINYEGGFKYGDRSFALNASAFYYDYKDYQTFLFVNTSGYVQNIDSKIYGIDVDTAIQLAEGLRTTLGFSYSHGEIKDFQVAPGIFRTVRPTFSPRTQATAAVNYEFPSDIAGGRLSLNALANYASGFYHNIRNFRADWFKGRTLLNLSASWSQAPEGLRVIAYLNNVFDKRYGQIGFSNAGVCGCNFETYGTPRTYGITVGYRF